jgi:hypothetical protein
MLEERLSPKIRLCPWILHAIISREECICVDVDCVLMKDERSEVKSCLERKDLAALMNADVAAGETCWTSLILRSPS